MNTSAIFSIQYSSENITLRTENTALLVIFESLKVAKTNYLSTRNGLNHRHAW